MSQLKAGDLAFLVRETPCCGNHAFLGGPYEVTYVGPSQTGWCRHCSAIRPGVEFGVSLQLSPDDNGTVEGYRVKRLPPPDELGIVDEKQPIEATV